MRLIKQSFLILILFVLTGFTIHIETVVVYKIHNAKDTLFITATMDKSYASILVMTKGEMITPKNRGVELNKIIKENTNFIINGTNHDLIFESAIVNHKNLVLKYYINDIPSKITTFTMINDVIVGDDELAIANAYINLKNKNRKTLRFNKKKKSRTIIF
jgi:hypothetical protein